MATEPGHNIILRVINRVSRRSHQESTKDYRKTIPFQHYISPLQLWLDRLVWRINKFDDLQNDWLPAFKIASAHLRTLFSTSKKGRRPVLAFLLTKEAGGMLLLGAILEALSAAATIGSPLVLRRLLLNPHNMVLGWTLFFMTLATTLLGRAKDQVCRTHYVWVEATSRVAILEKSMRLSIESRSMYPPEKVVNMSSVDAELLANYMLKLHDIWSAPIQIITICVLTVNVMGSTALFGFLVVLVIFVSQGWANKGIISAQRSYVSCNDGRLGTLTELLYGMKGVKALGYQDVFRERVKESREKQVKALTKYHLLSFCYFTAMNQAVAGFSAGTAFLAYYLMGHKLSSAIIFPALAYFNMLYLPVSNTSLAINRQCSTWPSFQRIRNFLTAEEAELKVESRKGRLVSVSFANATFAYAHDKKGEDFEFDKVLDVGSLSVARNELSIIIGPTGSGKSSFLKAILGEMGTDAGSHHVYGTLSYVSQDPWVFSGSLRDNIVFAANYDATRYHSVLRMCGLDQDFGCGFSSAEKVDTIIGESGNNLSGGQRARIALARAIYSDSDILLLDDPFSAVDAKTRLLLFQTIRRLKKTVILVTLHTSFLSMCDNVIVFDDNMITWTGTSKDFTSSRMYSEKYSTHVGELMFESLSDAETDSEDVSDLSSATTIDPVTTSAAEDIFEDEEKSRGAVSLDVLKFYCRCAGGNLIVLLASLIAGLLTVAKTMSSYWLVWWIDDGLGLKGIDYLGGYLALTVSPGLIESLLGLVLVVLSVGASKNIHAITVDNILAAPLSFFHRQPVGRILNRFSSDVMSMDIFIMNSMDGVLVAGTSLISSIVLVVAAAPVTLAVAVPYMIVAGWLLLKFAVAAREMQRSASILHSPVLAIISEAMRGIGSIKVYGAEKLIRGKYDKALDSYMSAKFCRNALDTWITFRAEIASAFLVLICAMLLVSGKMSNTQGGLALSNATTISNSVYVLAWCMCELQIKMNSIERLKRYYDGIPTETSGDSRRPSAGVIEFRKASVVYDSRRRPALDAVDLKIRKGERVGIIGRTGSGKSTLISALTCLVPLNGGTITMDDVDISHLDVQRLRTTVRTLTQEPLVLKGTIRENLDPTNTHIDAELIEALEKCQLKSLLVDHRDDPLSRELQPDSGELSTGQRQLLCAARVLLLKPDVLLVDEAAANIDFASDEMLQKALQELPKGTTIIAIAHRAATLAWMDRIICMENGQVFEDGAPLGLLKCNDSYFREVVTREGKVQMAEAMAKSLKDESS